MKDFFKGMIVGIGNITPGLSGSALLIVFGLYENCIKAVSNIFKNFKQSFKILFPVGLGIILGTFLFSNIIDFCITKYEVITKIIFIFFILGTIPTLFKRANKQGFNKKYLIPGIITFGLGLLLLFINPTVTGEVITKLTPATAIVLFLTGMVVAASTIIPGISSTVLLSLMGLYTTYLGAIAHLRIGIIIPIALGIAIGGFILSKVINVLLEKVYGYTFYGILGFVIATIPALIPKNINSIPQLIIAIVLGIGAFILTVSIEKRA